MAPSPPDAPKVDIILVFRTSAHPASKYPSKHEARENAASAEAEYARLLATLQGAGLRATGKRGQKNGQVLVFVWAPTAKLAKMVQRERYTDFLRGLPSTELVTNDTSVVTDPALLAPADRLRLVYEFVTSTRHDGGLGVVPGSKEWTRVESVFALHDHKFNDLWMRSWTRRQIGFGIGKVELDKIKDQFGEAVALYFAFLSTYTLSLGYIAGLGVVFYVLRMPYSVIYSSLLVLWSVTFVEFWRIRERSLAVRWGTRGSFRVERRRAQYGNSSGGNSDKFPWWKRDVRILASLPVIFLFAAALAALLTAIFLFEAFVTQLYTGPGQTIISFSPTLLFVALVPQLLGVYHSYAVKLTDWENHAHQSTYEASLTLKTFALSAVVAYLGLALSAFVYVPFSEQLMGSVSRTLFATSAAVGAHATRAADFITATGVAGTTGKSASAGGAKEFNVWARSAKTDPSRLQNQMFAYTVTNQAVGTFTEVGLPFVTRKIDEWRASRKARVNLGTGAPGASSGSSVASSSTPKKNGKRVVFEDEESGEKEEREFLASVRHEVALPDYTLFGDYSEMVTQFGYVALWSTIWPLAPVMAFLNNWLELRSDAFKITTHCRRPIPFRTETIGPWVDTLSFIAWLSALTNSALVYLFRPTSFPSSTAGGTAINTSDHPLNASCPAPTSTTEPFSLTSTTTFSSSYNYSSLVLPALLLALGASHAHLLARLLVRHVLERAVWRGSRAAAQEEEAERAVKAWYLRSLGVEDAEGRLGEVGREIVESDGGAEGESANAGSENSDSEDATGFWTRDEGLDEIRKAIKDA